MGTIKDIVDLTTQLSTSVSDRKVTDELNKIQSLILQLQSEQADLHEKNIQLRESLVVFKEKNHEQKEQIRKLGDSLEEKGKIQYIKPSYWIIDGDSKDGPFCQRCYDVDQRLVRLQDGGNDIWKCQECVKVFIGPAYHDCN